MRKKSSALILGIIFIAVGVVVAGKLLFAWDIDIFFDGWWTLFIIVPVGLAIIRKGPEIWNVAILVVGVLFLLGEQDILPGDVSAWQIALPVFLVAVGLNIIFSKPRVHIHNAENGTTRNIKAGSPDYTAIFWGIEERYPPQTFEGTSITAIFGGVELDLRDAIINGDIAIEVTCVFGGVELRLPPNVRINVSGTPIFGGVDNKYSGAAGEGAPTIFFNASCVFGGLEIR